MFKKQLLVLFLATLASHSLWAAQFARPVETTDAGAWTVEGTGAATHHEALNEDPQVTPDLDADFIAAGTSSTIILRLSGVIDPGGADASDHIIRYRCRVTGGGGPPERCNVAIVQGHPGGTEIYANTTVTAADDVFTLEQIAIPSATGITDYSDLYVHLTSDVGNGETIEISWFELEVPDVTATVPPTVTSPTFANEDDTTATLGGNVTDAGSAAVTDRGVEWGTVPGTYPTPVSEGGTGTGIFTVGVTGLPSSDVIYFRAWATSTVGTSTSAESSFTTFPTVTSPTSANVTDTTATLGGTVTADGDVAVDSRGIEWGTSPGTYPNSVPAAAGGAGTFTVPVTGLPSSDVIYFRAWATNAGGTSYSAESSFTTLPTVTSPTVDAFADTTATLGGTVTADGDVAVDSRGIEWGTSTGVTPNIEPAVAGGPGTFTVDVTGLPSNTEIFFRAWGTNAGGTGYSVESSFTTNPGQPTVDTPTATNITATTAELGGRVAGDGGGTVTDRGTVWGTSPNPTGNSLSQGTGTGTFSHQRTGLPTGTLVYFRAYATNAAGTAYSPDATFTPADVPTVTTPSVDSGSITTNSALLGGNVTSDGGAALTARGTVWNTTGTPVVENALAEGGTTTGTFTHTRSGLPPDTDIFFRAYATNATHTGYSPEGQFRTEAAADTQVSNLNFATTAGQSVRLTWTRGSLDGVLVVMRSSDGAVAPTDGTDYTPNAVFGSGSLLSPGNYVIYKGIGTSVLVTGLTMTTSYSVEAYEFSGDPASPTFLPGPASATDSTTDYSVHNYDYRADCDDCHNHGSFFARGAELKGVCSTCHNPTGLAQNKLEFGFEVTPTTTGHPDPTKNPAIDVVDCGMCHELHNHTPTSTNTTYSTHSETLLEQHNKSFLRANVDKYVPNAATPAYLHTDTPYRAGPPEILADTPDRAVEGGDDSTARGYCQVCHTLTDNHRSSNTAGSDQCHDGSPGCQGTEIHCGSCHQHTNNFEGEGDCTQCHNSIRGSRPIITTQFDDRASSHVTPDVGGVTQADCEVCHDQSTHKEKTVRLNDPDGGAAHSQPTPGASTLSTGEGEAFAAACIGCHDADGATRLASAGTPDQTPLSPFTDSPPPPIFDAAAWANSSHDRPVATSGSSPVTCVGGGANGCHGSGHGSENAPLLHPADTAITVDHATNLCLECHDGDGPSTLNIFAQFNTGTNYRTTAEDGANVNQRHDITNTPTDFATGDQTNSGGAVTCKDCHAPHANNDANPVFELDALQLDPPQHVALPTYDPAGRYNEDTWDFYYDSGGATPTDEDPTDPLGGSGPVPEPDYIQFCLACHDGTPPSASVTMSTSLTNMAAAWNNDQHGNAGGSTGSSISKGNLKPPWNTQALYELGEDPPNVYAALNCTTCHGAHGTGNIFNLRESITVAGVVMSTGCPGGETWCQGSEFAGTVGTTYTLPLEGGTQNDHKWGAWCTFCHNMSAHRGVSETTGCTSAHKHGANSF